MSTSPTRFYASRPSSRQNSRPTSPQNAADVRSQAVAKLKRAASLPRKPDGRRPSTGASSELSPAPSPRVDQTPPSSFPSQAGPSSLSSRLHPLQPSQQYGEEEMLSPSPVKPTFDLSNLYVSPPGQAMTMQRSLSEASSFHIQSPHFLPGMSPMGTPFFKGSPSAGGTPDWAAMQLAQSYLPSLSPVPVNSSPFIAGLTAIPGRNTPSPLPTLGDLRNLQRSNSAAARAKAMSKLTGGRDTPSDDSGGTSSKSGLQRADSLGPPKLLGLGIIKPRGVAKEEPASPTKALLEPRPRLQRSFTVSSSNMGEERRSAVGRRMVQRLAERKAAREEEEAEVRRLWVARRSQHALAEPEDEGEEDDEEGDEEAIDDTESPAPPALPRFERTSPGGPAYHPEPAHAITHNAAALGLPDQEDRPVSRGTMVSADEPFQYESHLSRSLSSRTAKGAAGVSSEAVLHLESIPSQEHLVYQDHLTRTPSLPKRGNEDDEDDDEDDLQPPRPAFATPTRHNPQPSTSSMGTLKGSQSPGGDSILSRDGLGSMMFIMGSSNPSGPAVPPREGSWPVGVQENGSSDWGTPGKEEGCEWFLGQVLTTASLSAYEDSPTPSMPRGAESVNAPATPNDGDLTPPAISRRTSGMSWEEVGGEADREVPTDARFQKKTGSISAKIGRTMKSAMRKRSASRSSVGSSTSPPRSPNPQDSLSIIAGYSRRESGSSTSPAATKAKTSPLLQQGEFIRHQPSVSSLSPSFQQPESSANSILLQHQLSSEPSSNGFLPRADLNDPRIHSSKLSPFPGMSSLEGAHRLDLGQPPKLVHQASDSVVPTQQRLAQASSDNIYSLPLPTPAEDRRASDDSVSKRSWLAKAFGQSPRSSLSNSRKNSSVDLTIIPPRKLSADMHPTFAAIEETDPFAGPPPPSAKQRLHRAGSPSVSVVPEASEEGSRMTRFTTHLREYQPSPLHSEAEEEQDLPQRSKDVLQRMDEVLALEPDDPGRPDILDDPPRKLLLATQTAKDRFLFLFNDILVITKPLISDGINATLDMKFIVKSVVSLDRLHASGISEDSAPTPERDALVADFVQSFAQSPADACKRLSQKNGWARDPMHLASILWKTPELDKTQLGALLCTDTNLLVAYIDLFHFRGVPLIDALRMFLLSLRLPGHPTPTESLLRGFAYRYHETNQSELPYSREMAAELVLSIMHLNDAMHGNRFGFAMQNPALRPDIFIASWRSKDSRGLVNEEMLEEVYSSLRRNQLAQALSASETHRNRDLLIRPAKLPSKLTYATWSEPITLCIPAPDQNFGVQLLGEEMEFDPPVLEFLVRNRASFRVRGTSLGAKAVLFHRIGDNAALYGSLPNGHIFNVERAFMRHTFQVSFSNHLGVKRKYCFSVTDASLRQKWATILPKQIALTRQHYIFLATSPRHKVRQAAESVSLNVLRDALIPQAGKSAPPHDGTSTPSSPHMERNGSVSIAYGEIASVEEAQLGPLKPTKAGTLGDRTGGMLSVQTGKELVLVCRQNSLLPGMLELLQAGVEPKGSRGENRV